MKNSKILLAIVASLYTGNLLAQDLFTLEQACNHGHGTQS